MPDSVKYVVIKQDGRKCPWCDKAIEALDNKGLAYQIRNLDGMELIHAAQKANMSTVPIIYHGETLIGGYDELQYHLGGYGRIGGSPS